MAEEKQVIINTRYILIVKPLFWRFISLILFFIRLVAWLVPLETKYFVLEQDKCITFCKVHYDVSRIVDTYKCYEKYMKGEKIRLVRGKYIHFGKKEYYPIC